MSSSISLKAIAQETNLSITTVSRVLRRQGEISEATRKVVLEAAKRMRYRPNLLVQGIQTGKTHTMGVMVPPFDSYWTKILFAIHDELTRRDHVFINAWCNPLEEGDGSYRALLLRQLHRLIDRRVDGLILWPHLAPLYNEHVEELEARNLPVVTIDHELGFSDSVQSNEQTGAQLAAEHLLDLGHRRVGQLAWDESYKWAQLRRTYFEHAIAAHPDGRCVTVMVRDDEEVADATRKLLAESPRITAIFACSDRVARLVYEVVKAADLRIPEEVSIVGFADLEFASWIDPPLTTIRQNGALIGRIAARMLVERSQGAREDAEPLREYVDCELVPRGSTCRVPADI